MLKLTNSPRKFCLNCIITYGIVGICAILIADSHESFLHSSQGENASNFSRIISLSVAHNWKQQLYR